MKKRLELAKNWVNEYGADYQVNLLPNRNEEFYDTLNEDATILIEWADKFNIEKYIKNYKIVNFKVADDNSRIITVK